MATIKKGTYRWNDSIDFSGNPSKILINILVKPAPIINQTEMTITADSSSSVRLGVITPLTSGVANREYALTYQEKEYAPVSYHVYDSLYGWNAAVGQFTEMGFTVDSAFNGFGKEFEVEEDTEVDDTAGTWFTKNTQMLIKAGTYRWNDVVDIPISTEYELPFTCDGVNYLSVGTGGDDASLPSPYTALGYISSEGFVTVYILGEFDNTTYNGWLDNKYQIITVTADTEVDDTFGTWFSDNTEPVVEKKVIKAGTYRFNETLTAIPATIQLPYEFYFGDGWESYTDIYLADNVLQWRAGEGSFVNNVYNYETQIWEYDSERVIIVDTPQTVSSDFYEWFDANIEHQTLKGKWKFRKELTGFSSSISIEQTVNFTCNGHEQGGFRLYGAGLEYLTPGGSGNGLKYNWIDGGFWTGNDIYRTVDFGETEQNVSQEFYDWFISNANEMSVIKAGTYTFNNTLTVPSAVTSYGYIYASSMSFRIVGGTYDLVSGSAMENGGSNFSVMLSEHGWVDIYNYSSGWVGGEALKVSISEDFRTTDSLGIALAIWFNTDTEFASEKVYHGTSITYADRAIANLNKGHIATLVCSDKTMVDDVVVKTTDGAACLLYRDKLAAYISGVKTAKYLCKDKSPTDNLIILAEPKPSEGLYFPNSTGSSSVALTGIGTCTDTDVVIPPVTPDGATVVLIPSSVGKSVFSDNVNLKSVFIPYGVSAIGSGAGLGHVGVFQGCTNLVKVEFSKFSRLGRIWENTFKDCVNLTSISIPKSVERIISNAFEGCTKLIQKDNGVHYVDKWVQGADESATSISLRKDTVGIVDDAFASHVNLSSVDLSSEITKISNGAFQGCKNLSSVKIPPAVTVIDEYAFNGCTSLSTITLPEGLTSLGYRAFYECTNLACHIVIPDAITLIDGDTFAYSGITGVTFPDGLKKIDDEAFESCLNLTDLILPNGIEEIGSYAFSRCSSLTSVEIPGSIETLGSYVFSSCPNLTRVVINKGVTSIGADMFAHCTGLTSVGFTGSGASVEIPDSVTSIGSWAFDGCTNLVTVKIPNSVGVINQYAFRGCNSLASIEIPDNVTSLGDYVFYDCASLASITIPAKVASIGANAFYNCSGLTSIAIPNSVTKIGAGAFIGCANLNSISVASDNASYKDINGNLYTNDGKTLIQYAMGKTDVNFTIPDEVTSIGDSALRTCKNLTSVSIPNSVTSIGIYAFAGCSSLTSIIIPDGVTTIKNQTFANCPSLTSVVIPASVTNIEVGAFYNCSNLKSIKYRGTEEQWNAITKGNAWDVYENNGYQPINYTITYNYTG